MKREQQELGAGQFLHEKFAGNGFSVLGVVQSNELLHTPLLKEDETEGRQYRRVSLP